jgi:hypothetical protein
MDTLQTAWPCAEERRRRRNWPSSKEPDKSVQAAIKAAACCDSLGVPHAGYSEGLGRRSFDRKRKKLTATIAADIVALDDDVAVVIAPAEDVTQMAARFQQYADIWDRETIYMSSTPRMVMHDAYQKIMAMGPRVVPILLADLQRTRRSWFWALRHLTNANPVPPEDQGNLDKMVSAWVSWGKHEGLI